VLAWAAAAVGPGARLRAVRALHGGIAQATDALTIDAAGGRRHRLVLQRWIRPGRETDDPGFDPAKEAAVLTALAPTVIPAPQLVAVDPDGSGAGVPALLIARLPGRQPRVGEVARPATLGILGAMLAAIHRVGADLVGDRGLQAVVPPYRPFGDLASAVIPTTTRRPDLWQAALSIAGSTPAPAAPTILIHRDYHAGNTLWVGDRLTGVVDWTSASWGPAAADLAHLRVDLVVDVSVSAAVRVRQAFADAGGDLTNARHHQLRTVFGYLTDRDPAALDGGEVARLDAFLELVLAEPDGPGNV
jgi:aminoglycoside phosphotransferase (APT) family kinase protein